MKRCYKCKRSLDLTHFFIDVRRKGLRDNKCKECRREYYREYTAKNREKINKYKAEWYQRKKHAT